MNYDDLSQASELIKLGGGSLVSSIFTFDSHFANNIVADIAAWNGRIYINNRESSGEATGHGSPLPHLTHGGPGRAGGGEEQGGIRGVKHYMQRTAIQGSPQILSVIKNQRVLQYYKIKRIHLLELLMSFRSAKPCGQSQEK